MERLRPGFVCDRDRCTDIRSRPGGRNAPTDEAVQVPCLELSFFTALPPEALGALIAAIYAAHPYEEPVILVQPALRTMHVRGLDEDNPSRFWNRPDATWVPAPHRGGRGKV